MVLFKHVGDNIEITKANGDIITVPASAWVKENCCTTSVYLRFDNPANNIQINYSEEISIDGGAAITGVDEIGSALSEIFEVTGDGGEEGNGAALDVANTFTESQTIQKDSADVLQFNVRNTFSPDGFGVDARFESANASIELILRDDSGAEVFGCPDVGEFRLRSLPSTHATYPSQVTFSAGEQNTALNIAHIKSDGVIKMIIGDPEQGAVDPKAQFTENNIIFLLANVPAHADNAAATGAGLTAGMIYRTGDALKIVH